MYLVLVESWIESYKCSDVRTDMVSHERCMYTSMRTESGYVDRDLKSPSQLCQHDYFDPRCLLLGRKCPVVVGTLVTCTPTWPPSTSARDASRVARDPSPSFLFWPCPTTTSRIPSLTSQDTSQRARFTSIGSCRTDRFTHQSTCFLLSHVSWNPPSAKAWRERTTTKCPTSCTRATPSARTWWRWKRWWVSRLFPRRTCFTWTSWRSLRWSSWRRWDCICSLVTVSSLSWLTWYGKNAAGSSAYRRGILLSWFVWVETYVTLFQIQISNFQIVWSQNSRIMFLAFVLNAYRTSHAEYKFSRGTLDFPLRPVFCSAFNYHPLVSRTFLLACCKCSTDFVHCAAGPLWGSRYLQLSGSGMDPLAYFPTRAAWSYLPQDSGWVLCAHKLSINQTIRALSGIRRIQVWCGCDTWALQRAPHVIVNEDITWGVMKLPSDIRQQSLEVWRPGRSLTVR